MEKINLLISLSLALFILLTYHSKVEVPDYKMPDHEQSDWDILSPHVYYDGRSGILYFDEDEFDGKKPTIDEWTWEYNRTLFHSA